MTLSSRFVLSFALRHTSHAHHPPLKKNLRLQVNKKSDKAGQFIQDLQRTIQDLKKDLAKSKEKVRLLSRSNESIFHSHVHTAFKIMDLQKELDTPRSVSPQTASPVSAQVTMQQSPFNPFLAMQQQTLQLQALKGTPYEGMMMPATTPNPAMAMNPFAFMPGMMDPMSMMMMMSRMMPMVKTYHTKLHIAKKITTH